MNEIVFPKSTDFIQLNGVSFTHGDIESVVQNFYSRIQHDPHLEVPFRSVKDWPEHMKRLTHFWWIRFGGEPYLSIPYDPVTKHFFAGFNDELLTRWLAFFRTTVENCLSEKQQKLWITISERMGQSLSIRNELFRQEHES